MRIILIAVGLALGGCDRISCEAATVRFFALRETAERCQISPDCRIETWQHQALATEYADMRRVCESVR